MFSVCVLLELLQPCIEPEEVKIEAEPDADRDDQHDIELVLGEKIQSYPFD
jgi:hypothetical protein